jgi:hypothetical protein
MEVSACFLQGTVTGHRAADVPVRSDCHVAAPPTPVETLEMLRCLANICCYLSITSSVTVMLRAFCTLQIYVTKRTLTW